MVISVRDDADWACLRAAIGDPAWALDPALTGLAGRLAAADVVDRHLSAWTAARTRDEVWGLLQQAGVPCGPMLTGTDMLDDPHLRSRGWTIELDQPGVGPMALEGPAWVAPSMPGPITTPAPGLGEHTREIAMELLGLSPDEIEELIARGVLEPDQ